MSVYSSQIIKTLSEQVQHLQPLRQSHHHLQAYHAKLIQDMQEAIAFGNMSQADAESKIQYLEHLNKQLEDEAYGCAEEGKKLECEYAKSVMEANQKAAHCQALQNKWQLQLDHQQALLNKSKVLAQANQNIYFNITKHQDLIHQLELNIKSKEYENLEIQRQIKKMELVNSKIQKFNQQSQSNITKVQSENEKITQNISTLQSKIDTYDKLISTKQKMNKQSLELLICKTRELEELKHRNNYINRLVETQQSDVMALSRNCYELQSFLKLKKQKIMALKEENMQYEKVISQESKRKLQNKRQLGQLSYRLKTFVETNQTLYKALQRSCTQDRDVQIKLSQKLQKLFVTGQKMSTNEVLLQFDVNCFSKYQNWADFARTRGRSQATVGSKQPINENQSTGEEVFSRRL